MGRALIFVPRTAAEHSTLSLQHAAVGSPVLIPGAWNTRAATRPLHVTAAANPHSTFAAPVSVMSDRERLERELEGGGAPSERARGHRPTVLTRLWRTTLHPTKMRVIWSGAVLQSL